MKSNVFPSIVRPVFVTCSVLTGSPGPVAAAECTLTAADFQSLQLSPSHIMDRAQVDALLDDRQTLLCKTRIAWSQMKTGEYRGDYKHVSVYFLSPRKPRSIENCSMPTSGWS
jgi:hypothetical protein